MSADKPQLSIIIISYNTARITMNCLESIDDSLKGSDIETEVLVVDNASTDTTIADLRELKVRNYTLRVIQNNTNTGFGRANNQAVLATAGDYILLLNSDTVALDDAIPKLYSFYQRNAYQFVGAKLLNEDRSAQPSCGHYFTLPVVFATLFLRGDRWGLSRSSPDKTTPTDWVSGACIMTRKQYYDSIHGFDEGIFMYMEEVEMLYRARQAKMTIAFYPGARFVHLGSASSSKTYPIIQTFRGFKYLYARHHSKTAQSVLMYMLRFKCWISVTCGILLGNGYLVETYTQARQEIGK